MEGKWNAMITHFYLEFKTATKATILESNTCKYHILTLQNDESE